jgi:serine/threonine protein kinase
MSSKPAFAKQISSIGGFTIGPTFGNGNHALIRMGEQKSSGEQVVIKEIQKSTPSTNRKLRRELETMAKLKHPHIVYLHHHAETNDRFFLIMQYAKRGDLLDIILKSQHLNAEQSRKWFAQLVLGVEYMHSVGVCHCDLKPDNIFIDEHDNVKLGDFGLSCNYDKNEPRVLARPGTLHYSAPETFARHLHSFGFDAQSYFGAMGIDVDPATHCAILNGPELDVWGLGVCLYVMQTGKYPFWGVNRENPDDQLPTIEAILCQEQPKWPAWIEPGCADLLMRIFNKNPRQRITIVEIKQHPWVRAEMDRQMALVREAEIAAQIAAVHQQLPQQQAVPSNTPTLAHQNSQQLLLQQLRSQLVDGKRHKRNKSAVLPRSDVLSRTPSSCSREASPSVLAPMQPMDNDFRRASRSNLLRLHQFSTCFDLRQAVQKPNTAAATAPVTLS